MTTKKGFTLIEMLIYIALFSVFTVSVSLLYTQIQLFFVNTQINMQRYIVNQYVKRVIEHTVDFTYPSCTQGGFNAYCNQINLLDSIDFQRISFLGDISNVTFDIQGSLLSIEYELKIGKKVFLEHMYIYLI